VVSPLLVRMGECGGNQPHSPAVKQCLHPVLSPAKETKKSPSLTIISPTMESWKYHISSVTAGCKGDQNETHHYTE